MHQGAKKKCLRNGPKCAFFQSKLTGIKANPIHSSSWWAAACPREQLFLLHLSFWLLPAGCLRDGKFGLSRTSRAQAGLVGLGSSARMFRSERAWRLVSVTWL